MSQILESLEVDLGDRSYPIAIGSGLLSSTECVAEYILSRVRGNQVCIVSNETVAPLYLLSLREALQGLKTDVCILPDGEKYKNLDHLNRIFSTLLESRHNRRTCLIALGGGVVGDMTGFAAACYQRGVDFIQVPTTLLSQVDSSVGGKTGVNHALGKNMIGAFKQPLSVLIDIDMLQTLPEEEFAAGMAEVIKYGLISDAGFFEWLEENRQPLLNKDPAALTYAIRRSCEIKAEVVAADETEQGLRAILNLGHTFGHAIETHTGYGSWLHGQAVATGMLMAVRMSTRLYGLSCETEERTISLLSSFKLPLIPPAGMTRKDFMAHMAVDKKNVDSSIRLVLLEALGQAVVRSDYPMDLLSETIDSFLQ